MSNIETIVIVGAGQAGASAILELHGQKYEGKIILIGDENICLMNVHHCPKT